ncbi:hypothetical protein [Burkholderia cenocepacia]|uniref:Uncharacterized protein n=1 Tax=Burkholderia cenocepacia TaxID=95486 RepID=A0A6B2MTN5_9BURK|nr:hypothetical protein [Burkholderia cenocepacia]NDV77307.1 hypothetical protein [Burkholderia cenocepacia]
MKITDDMLTDEDLLRLWKKANGTHPDWGVFGHIGVAPVTQDTRTPLG